MGEACYQGAEIENAQLQAENKNLADEVERWQDRVGELIESLTQIKAKVDGSLGIRAGETLESKENARLREALGAQKEYVEFLEEACRGPEAIAAIHGMEISEEKFKEGERLRAKIAALHTEEVESE